MEQDTDETGCPFHFDARIRIGPEFRWLCLQFKNQSMRIASLPTKGSHPNPATSSA